MALITTARAQETPGINRIASGAPGWLENLIDAASTAVEQYCGRKFELEEYEELKDGPGEIFSFLTILPVVSVTEVAEIATDLTETLYASTDVVFDAESGQIRYIDRHTFPAGFQNLRFTYTGGYAEIPEDVQEATAQIVLQMAAQGSTSNDLALGAESAGDYTYGARSQADRHGIFPPTVKHLLEKYRVFCSGTLTVVGAASFAGLVITPDEITGNVDDYDPDNLEFADVVRLSSDGPYNITGLVPGPRHLAGRPILLQNINAADDFTLVAESGSSTAAYRFASGYTLANGTAVTLRHDATSARWYVVS